MRSTAFALDEWAAQVATIEQSCAVRAAGLDYEGPAAERFFSAIQANRSVAAGISDRLRQLAEYLLREATILEQEQAEARRRLQGGW